LNKSIFACITAAFLIVGCSGPLDTKLSEMNEPAQAVKLREAMTNEEMDLLRKYVLKKTLNNTIDYKVTVKEAIAAQRKEEADIKAVTNAIK
jgi:hypothetical protein